MKAIVAFLLAVFLLTFANLQPTTVVGDNRKDADGNSIPHSHYNPTLGVKEFWNGALIGFGIKPELTQEQKDKINENNQDEHPDLQKQDAPTWGYDCHGFTFEDGEVWINDGDVGPILEAGWNTLTIPPEVAVPGDIVIYRDGQENIKHSGKITQATPTGEVTEVESKWGAEGR
jgi:hypothetical protein